MVPPELAIWRMSAVVAAPRFVSARVCLLDSLTAAFSRALTNAEISSNVVAALFHDHIFVRWEQREEALQVLTALRG